MSAPDAPQEVSPAPAVAVSVEPESTSDATGVVAGAALATAADTAADVQEVQAETEQNGQVADAALSVAGDALEQTWNQQEAIEKLYGQNEQLATGMVTIAEATQRNTDAIAQLISLQSGGGAPAALPAATVDADPPAGESEPDKPPKPAHWSERKVFGRKRKG